MKFWLTLRHSSPSELVELAVTAEDAGVHGVMISDHLFVPHVVHTYYPYSDDGKVPWDLTAPWPDPWPVFAAMAGRTERIHFSTNILILPLRNPIEVARTLATVSHLAPGRLTLGVGLGWMAEEYQACGIDFASRGGRYDEALQILRLLWSGNDVEFHGEFFDFDPIRINPGPTSAIPIYIAGPSRRAMRRAAQLGDGWISGALPPNEVANAISMLRRMRADTHHETAPFDIITFAPRDINYLRHLGDLGVTAIIDTPSRREFGPATSLEQRRDAVKRFADEVVHAL